MKVLSVSYEVAPIFKVGGLGDVAGSLPKALAKLGVDMTLVMPDYDRIRVKKERIKETLTVWFDDKEEEVAIFKTILPNTTIPVYLLNNSHYLDDLHKPPEKHYQQFAFFSKAVSEFIHLSGNNSSYRYDILHLHDWHTALVPFLLKYSNATKPIVLPKTLLTIHNFGYQAITSGKILTKLGISAHATPVVAWDMRDHTFEYLKQGIIHADFINTVSKTYRDEILDPRQSGKLAQIAKAREGRIVGILNGIDYDTWDPETDKYLVKNYHPKKFSILKKDKQILPSQTGKRINKRAVQKAFGLSILDDIPLFTFIGRVEPTQKGIDILMTAFDDVLTKSSIQLAILGTGDTIWAAKLHRFVSHFSKKAAFIDRFDEALAHKLYAGADFMVIPSKYEPCGLVQMIAMRYGTIPLVRKTGGLADTVEEGKTGLLFNDYSGKELAQVLRRAIKVYNQDQHTIDKMRQNDFGKDFSWEKSAREYLKLYKKIIRT